MAKRKRPNQSVDIINAFQGKEAEELYNKLIGKKGGVGRMKNILELVGKIEELLKKSKFVWFMTYDPKEKAWTFQVKEK